MKSKVGKRLNFVRTARCLVFASLMATAAGSARPDGEAPVAPTPLLERIGRAAVDLARRGRRAEAEELVDVAADLHAPAADLTTVRDSVTKALAKAKTAPLPIPDASKTIAKIAADLAATLAALDGATKSDVARQTIRLDANVRAAHEAIGDVEQKGVWWPASVAALLPRRGEIEEALRAARRLDVKVEPSAPDPILERVHGRSGAAMTSGALTIASASFGPERIARQLREDVRAAALVNWMLTGEMKVPEFGGRRTLVAFDKHEDYLRALDVAAETGAIKADDLDVARKIHSYVSGERRLHHAFGETGLGAWLMVDALAAIPSDEGAGRRTIYSAQPTLYVGLLNWISARFLGSPAANIVWMKATSADKGTTSDTAPAAADRDAMLRLSKAGFAGSRRWMQWLARRGEDPAWSKSMVDDMSKIQGDDILKTMLVADYLLETKELAHVVRASSGAKPGPAPLVEALGVPLADFEIRFREWLLAGEPPAGLVQRLGAAPAAPVSAADKAVLDRLDKLRREALGKDAPALGVDGDLSDGCRAHALYLDKHPKQKAAWPDCHEEYPDQEGFTPAGGRAGLESVVYPDVDSADVAIDGWMATFYHRLPLLAPGLVRVGWGFEKDVAVLDVGSIVAPADKPTTVSWPAAGAKDVPRRFIPEMPNPVPGEDQATWGYPVTLQFFGVPADPDVQMRLYVGTKRGGTEVPCHCSTPNTPTNPMLAPSGAFCLMPKQTLAANTTYTVAVDGWPAVARGADWTFTTGAK